jgi:hypothetical protein
MCVMISSIMVNCPWGSARSSHVAPVHFQLPIDILMLSLHVCAPLPVPRGPPAKGPVCSGRDLPPSGAQHAPVVRPLFTFGRNLRPGFEFCTCACARPVVADLGDKGVGLSGELVSAQHAIVLLPDPRHAARRRHLSIHIQIVMCQVPPTSCCDTGSQIEVIAG